MTKKQFTSLKVGNKVRLRKGLKIGKTYGDILLLSDKMKFSGIQTVLEKERNDARVSITPSYYKPYWYSYQMLIKAVK